MDVPFLSEFFGRALVQIVFIRTLVGMGLGLKFVLKLACLLKLSNARANDHVSSGMSEVLHMPAIESQSKALCVDAVSTENQSSVMCQVQVDSSYFECVETGLVKGLAKFRNWLYSPFAVF